MSLAGFKKQVNKVNQYMSEKIGGAKGTELDYDFIEMERKMDVMGKVVEEMIARTHELLQPNPASRAKLSAVNSISKMRGQAKHALYPQPEGQLGDCMVKYGKELGEESMFGGALVETGDAYKQMADVKYSLEDNVKQNFIEPLHHLQSKELKEINHHRKKLSGRRLDFDCKKRKQTKGVSGSHVSEEDIRAAEDKFDETKELTETAMFNLLENDVEQMSQLSSFVEAELNFHRQCTDVLQSLFESLQQRCSEAASRPRSEYIPKRTASRSKFDSSPNYDNNYDLGDQSGYSLSPAKPAYGGSRDDDDDDADDGKGELSEVGEVGEKGETEHTDQTDETGETGQTDETDKTAETDKAGETDQTDETGQTAEADKTDETGQTTETDKAGENIQTTETDKAGGETGQTADTVESSEKLETSKAPVESGEGEKPAETGTGGSQPCCEALYDFDPENEGELGFREGDIVQLISRIDENWYEGSINGNVGFFPVNYVKVIVDVQ